MFSETVIKKEDLKENLHLKKRKNKKRIKKNDLDVQREQINRFAEIIVNHLLKSEVFYD